MYRIGFLGLGKMGSSILQGILNNGLYSKDDICFYAPSENTQSKGKGLGIALMEDEVDLVTHAKIVLLAIEPQKYNEVLSKFKGLDFKGQTVISIAPGKTIEYLKSAFANADIVRAMPNIPSTIGKGATTIAFEDKPIEEAVRIFSSIGTYAVIEESKIEEYIPLQGSMPAYILAFVKGFVDAAKEHGIEEPQARKLALQSIIGSSELALNSDKPLEELIDSVCSRGGSTIAGLEEMKRNGFEEAIDKGYKACVKRSKELKG